MVNLLLILTLAVNLAHAVTTPAVPDCPPKWKGFGDSCYLFVEHTRQQPTLTFEEAQANCLGYDGHLLIFSNASEIQFILSQTKSMGNQLFWFGLYRNITTNDPKAGWIWVNNVSLTTPKKWNYGEPNNYKGVEKCAAVYGLYATWNDDNCDKKYPSICQRKKGLPLPTSPPNTTITPFTGEPPKCDYGWNAFDQSCYRIFTNALPWSDAQKACRNTGGHLVTIDDSREQNYLTFEVRKYYWGLWIGLNAIEVDRRWVWEGNATKQVTYFNWQVGEPNSFQGKERCVEMYGSLQAGLWNDASCSGRKSYVCEKENGLNMCPDNWVPYNGSCYQFNLGSSQKLSWQAAQNACISTGGSTTLVTIKSKDEQDFLRKRVQDITTSEVWIGLNDKETETVFKWSDGSSLGSSDYAIWANGKPSENQADKGCVMMINARNDGAWSVQKCTLKRNFICKRDRDLTFCNIPVGMENGNILDSQISASSSSFGNEPKNGRYGHDSYWCSADNDKKAFIEVDLGSLYNIRKIVVEGNVTRFTIRYGKNGIEYKSYAGIVSSGVSLKLLTARFVQIYPYAYTGRVCLRLELVGCVAKVASKTECSTGDNWETGPGNMCYQINRNFLSWTEARSRCLDQNADLLSIRNEKELAAIIKRLKVLTGISSLWISLNDRDYTDFFYWSNGDSKSLVNFGSGYPSIPGSDKYNKKSCIEMYTSDGTWKDIPCFTRKPFICMKRPNDRRSSFGNIVYYGPTGVWISTAKYYWPLSDALLGTKPGKAYGNIKQIDGLKNVSNTALQFTIAGSYIEIGDFDRECLTFPEACQNGLTLSFMASFDTAAVNWNKQVNIIDSVQDDKGFLGIAAYIKNQELWFMVSKAYKVVMSSVKISGDKTWRHYAIRYNETGIYFSVNGKLLTTSTTTSTRSSVTKAQSKLLIGLQSNSKVTSGVVSLSMIAFWEISLSDDDIMAIYKTEFGRCETGWVEFGMSCYQFNNDAKSKQDGENECQRGGGELVTIESSVEQSFVAQKVLDRTWIGITDAASNHFFQQKNGDEIKYSNWQYWEPNEYFKGEDCVEMLSNGQWNDAKCYERIPYICEKQKTTKSLDSVKKPSNVVSKFERVCQYSKTTIGCPLGLKIKINWAFWGRRNKGFCRFISVTNCGINGITATTKILQKRCDGASKCDIHAAESELGKPCPTIEKYLEVNYTCVSKSTNSRCPSGWQLSTDNRACYKLFDKPKAWQDADSDCQSQNSRLVSIPNAKEQSLLTSLMERVWYSEVWIGFNDLKTRGTYQWSDGSSITWSNWYVGQPDERDLDKSCVFMSMVRMKRSWMYWRDANCSSMYPYMCKKVVNSAPVTPSFRANNPTPTCRNGWTNYGQYCYRMVEIWKTWFDASQYCNSYAMDKSNLVTIENQKENDFITKLTNYTIWIGLNSRGVFRGHAWSGDQPLSYTNWDVDQPDSYDGIEPCVHLDPVTGYWSDVYCYSTKPFVCKKLSSQNPVTTQSPVTFPTSGSSHCKQGWILYNGMCYYAYNDTSPANFVTWHDAEAKCRSMNSHLASITSANEQAFLNFLVKNQYVNDYWIGLNDLDSESSYRWSDGSVYGAYLNWARSEPNDHQRQEDCVHFSKRSSGQWNDQHCSIRYSFICKAYNNSYFPLITIGPPISPDGYCPQGWVVQGQWCYEFHLEEGDYKTWDAARESCERGTNSSSFGELASITNQYEQAFLTFQIRESKVPLWIGLNNRHSYSYYRWVDNSPLKYFNWGPNEPNSRYYKKCVDISPYAWSAGDWTSDVCQKKQAYICKKAASKIPITATPAYTPTPTEQPQITCPDGYKRYIDSCYKFIKDSPQTFDDARKVCQKDNGDLVIPGSKYEQAYLVYTLERFVGNVWIGLVHEAYSEFKFVDHSTVPFTHWGKQQPDRRLEQRSCTQANVTASVFGDWDDVDCNIKKPFVCQIYKGEPRITMALNASCPDGWRKHEEHCYKHFPRGRTWSQAQHECSIVGGDLTSIHNDREQDFLMDYFKDLRYYKRIWIGLNDRSRERGYTWINRHYFDYVNWDKNEPSDRVGYENCVEMNTATGKWNDVTCASYLTYMCKQELQCYSVLDIDPSTITVTDSINNSFTGNEAIINDDKSTDVAWCTNNPTGKANITIHLGRLVQISSIAIQGKRNEFVKSFRVDYGRDGFWNQYIRRGGHGEIEGDIFGGRVIQKRLQPSIVGDTLTITPLTWTPLDQTCMKIRLYGCEFVCQKELIRIPSKLADDFITASSSDYPTHSPKQASARGGLAWCAKTNDDKQWIQFNFGREYLISKFRSYGDGDESFVKTYKLQYSADGTDWIDYKQYGTVRIFKGGNNAVNPAWHHLSNTIEASYFRFIPLSWNKNICMKFQLSGCLAACDKALLNSEDNEVKLSSSAGPDSHPEFALFNSGKAWCTNKSPLSEQYLQIDFPRRMRVMKISTQASPQNYGAPRQVSTYLVSFTIRAKTWRYYLNRITKRPKVFLGVDSTNPNKAKTVTLSDRPLNTRSLKIYPQDFSDTEICMKVEVYGCLSVAEIKPTEEPTKQKVTRVSLRVTSIEWNEKLKDKKSEEYKKTSEMIEDSVRQVYSESPSLRDVEVQELKQGSVIAVLKLIFNPAFAENATSLLAEAVRKGKVGSLEVDETYFIISKVDVQAQKSESSSGLSGGAVAGIVITVLLVIAAVAVGFLFYRRKKRKNLFSPQHFENPISFSSKAYDMDD